MDFSLTPDVRFRRYFVLFRKTQFRMWWSWFTVPGLEHCSVVESVYYPDAGYSRMSYFIHTETCYGLTNQELYWESAESMIASRLKSGAITVAVVVSVDKNYQHGYIPFGLFTCVTIVKSLLGVHNWRIQTPQSLLRYLEKKGATVIWAM